MTPGPHSITGMTFKVVELVRSTHRANFFPVPDLRDEPGAPTRLQRLYLPTPGWLLHPSRSCAASDPLQHMVSLSSSNRSDRFTSEVTSVLNCRHRSRGFGQLLRARSIKTVGDLSALTPAEIKTLPIHSPKILNVKKALKSYQDQVTQWPCKCLCSPGGVCPHVP